MPVNDVTADTFQNKMHALKCSIKQINRQVSVQNYMSPDPEHDGMLIA